MKKAKRVLAFDFGASSGRAMIGTFDGENIQLEEIHRFSNDPVSLNGTLYWDVLRLFYEIKQGMLKAHNNGGFDSVGIDTWGVDFGLLDAEGNIMENPVHYRDERTVGMIDESFKFIDKDRLYKITGNQFMELNTLFQIVALLKYRPHMLERADKILLMPDLFAYMLTGAKSTEYTVASTTQMLDAEKRDWSPEIFKKIGIPKQLFPDIVKAGNVKGKLSDSICEELGVSKVDVISVASHDTKSAIAAVPTQEKDYIFISCGTWSMFGTVIDTPIINEKSKNYNLTNEGGYNNCYTFMKTIIGLWLIQESRRQWQREGKDYSFAQLEKMALESEPFACFIDPDAPDFVAQGNLPKRIKAFCERTNQKVPETVGAVVRCIYESLAMKYRYAFEQIRDCTGKNYSAIHMVGGGTKDTLLCKMAANSCNCKVVAGPIEATVLGNIAVQLITSGDISSIEEARKIIAKSQTLVEYQPTESGVWDAPYLRFKKYVKEP